MAIGEPQAERFKHHWRTQLAEISGGRRREKAARRKQTCLCSSLRTKNALQVERGKIKCLVCIYGCTSHRLGSDFAHYKDQRKDSTAQLKARDYTGSLRRAPRGPRTVRHFVKHGGTWYCRWISYKEELKTSNSTKECVTTLMISRRRLPTIQPEQKFTLAQLHSKTASPAQDVPSHTHAYSVPNAHTPHARRRLQVQPIPQTPPAENTQPLTHLWLPKQAGGQHQPFQQHGTQRVALSHRTHLIAGSLCIFIPGSVSLRPLQQHIHAVTVRYLVNFSPPFSRAIKPERHIWSFQALSLWSLSPILTTRNFHLCWFSRSCFALWSVLSRTGSGAKVEEDACCAKPDLLSGQGKLLCYFSPIRKLRGGLAGCSGKGAGNRWVGFLPPLIPAMRKVWGKQNQTELSGVLESSTFRISCLQ